MFFDRWRCVLWRKVNVDLMERRPTATALLVRHGSSIF